MSDFLLMFVMCWGLCIYIVGWKANLDRQSALMVAPPVVQGGMARENIVPSNVQ